MEGENMTTSGWRYWIEAPSVFPDSDDPTVGALVLRSPRGDDICIDLCPGHVHGQAAQEDLRRRIIDIVDDPDESREIFDSTEFVLPDLIAMRSTLWQNIA